MIGWIVLLTSLTLILGSLFMLRDTSNTVGVSGEKLEKVRKRRVEQETLDKQNKQDD